MAAGDIIFPAVGRLIFASYPEGKPRTGSHLFDSPRPCPHSRLGSRLRKGASHNAHEGWPPHPVRFTSWLISMSCVGFGINGCDCRLKQAAPSGEPLARGAAGGLTVTVYRAQQGPDEAAEFAGDGDLGFVALEAASQEPGKAQV